MNQPKFLSFAGASPGKLTLIGVLAVVLIAVIAWQFAPTSSPKPAPRTRPAPNARPTAAPQAAAKANSRSTVATKSSNPRPATQKPAKAPSPQVAGPPQTAPAPPKPEDWPEAPVQSLLSHNPFTQPEWLRPTVKNSANSPDETADTSYDAAAELRAQRAADEATLAQMQAQGVGLLMIEGDDRWAKIGNRRLRVGDQVGRFVVEAIQQDGVVLVETENP